MKVTGTRKMSGATPSALVNSREAFIGIVAPLPAFTLSVKVTGESIFGRIGSVPDSSLTAKDLASLSANNSGNQLLLDLEHKRS